MSQICRFCLSEANNIQEHFCDAAARIGHVFCLERAHNHFGVMWNEDTCYYAATRGKLDCLIYLHENGCPWDNMTCIGAAQYVVWNMLIKMDVLFLMMIVYVLVTYAIGYQRMNTTKNALKKKT
jgi:hypothetical protein